MQRVTEVFVHRESALHTCALTLPSRGCPKGCAFCAPFMSNVRPSCMNANAAPSYAALASERISSLRGSLAVLPRVECRSRAARAARPSAVSAPLPLCRERTIPSRSRSVPLVKQSIQNRAFVQARCRRQEKTTSAVFHKVSRSGTVRCSSSAAVRQLVSERVAAQRSRCRLSRPNPSIEGMPKRLRLLCTPHVKR
jgi:hypothetical protein